MKRVFIIFLFILSMISYQNVIFASYDSQALEDELHTQVQMVFKERSRIWNQFLMGQYLSVDQMKEDLKEFIADPLLNSDIKMFQEMLNNPTSYEEIASVKVKDIDIVKNTLNGVELEAFVLWNISGYENEYTEEIKYIIKMNKMKENWLLSNYEITQ